MNQRYSNMAAFFLTRSEIRPNKQKECFGSDFKFENSVAEVSVKASQSWGPPWSAPDLTVGLDARTGANIIKVCFSLKSPIKTWAPLRQCTWQTRPDPWPQIVGTLNWVPFQQVEPSCFGLMAARSTTAGRQAATKSQHPSQARGS